MIEHALKGKPTVMATRQKHSFVNKSGLKFTDISSELQRTYVFPNGEDKIEITIDLPQELNVSKNGHRVFDSHGNSHYIPKGWIHLYWKVCDNAPNFVK